MQRLNELKQLKVEVESKVKVAEKLAILNKTKQVQNYLQKYPCFSQHLEELPLIEQLVVKSVIVCEQAERVFAAYREGAWCQEEWLQLIKTLLAMEDFYDSCGGVIGYQLLLYQLIYEVEEPLCASSFSTATYYQPPGKNIMELDENIHQAIKQAIIELPHLAELYAVGGAGDRLNLKDPMTGKLLPAALLPFCGHTLLEGLVRDSQGREFLYYRLFHKQVTTPIAMMTSPEKENHLYITELCENSSWFGRPKDSFIFFEQPLVPVVTNEGEWIMKNPLELTLKPGGHGVIWKNALDHGVFDWLEKQGVTRLIVRQINNPVAGEDYGLLAFYGIGCKENKSFGFASCSRRIQAAEGMNVLCEKNFDDGYRYCISNIEYTDFQKKGVNDVPASEGSNYSAFPANTNILYATIEAIKEAITKSPIPGLLINYKSTFNRYTGDGEYEVVHGGRLESTMQNIADVIEDYYPMKKNISSLPPLKTFMTYNLRRKTLSVTKNEYQEGGNLKNTPLGCFYEHLLNKQELFVEHLGFTLPNMSEEESFLEKGPSFLIHYHPALGPLWSVIEQKIQGGSFAYGAELQLEIAEIAIENLQLEGSLLIEAEDIMGGKDQEGVIQYGKECGKCILKNVTVRNEGIDRLAENSYWCNEVQRKESLKIVLMGNGEFYAENVTLEGDQLIEVADGYRITALQEGGEVVFKKEEIDSPSWLWKYQFDEESKIQLSKVTQS